MGALFLFGRRLFEIASSGAQDTIRSLLSRRTDVGNGTFEFTLRVYFEDTDAGGMVFYANYLKFFERARTEWLRASGVEQQRMSEETGLMFAVRRTELDYLRPARLDDLVSVVSRIERIGGASAEFYQEAWRVGQTDAGVRELLVTGRIKVACVRWQRSGRAAAASHPGEFPAELRPAPIPEYVRDALLTKFPTSHS